MFKSYWTHDDHSGASSFYIKTCVIMRARSVHLKLCSLYISISEWVQAHSSLWTLLSFVCCLKKGKGFPMFAWQTLFIKSLSEQISAESRSGSVPAPEHYSFSFTVSQQHCSSYNHCCDTRRLILTWTQNSEEKLFLELLSSCHVVISVMLSCCVWFRLWCCVSTAGMFLGVNINEVVLCSKGTRH